MKIIDIDVKELNRATRRARSRSPETDQLVDVISGLKPDEAKAVVLDEGDSVKKMRSRLTYAARLAGKRLQIGYQGDQVLFALSNRPVRSRSSSK